MFTSFYLSINHPAIKNGNNRIINGISINAPTRINVMQINIIIE